MVAAMAGTPPDPVPTTVPRGRHAPPIDVRLGVQRRRLFRAAASVFARQGYADATAEAISREAGMSKATFYEHFANKEECILALFDVAATEVMRAMANAGGLEDGRSYRSHVRAGLRGFLQTLADYPESAQTVLVEIIGAGPRAVERRDAILGAFADALYRDNLRVAPSHGAPTFASRDDAFAVIGGIVELVSRHLRTGRPERMADLEPVIERLVFGVLTQGAGGRGPTPQRPSRRS
jgi:AcrR family transcriptional regulator